MANKKKISKSSKRRLAFFGTLSVIIIFYFLFSSGYYIYKIYNLKHEEKKLTEKLGILEREAKILSNDMEKLKDPEYLAKYAREAYSYSKKDEIIIQKYKDEEITEEKNDINFSIKDKYIITICVGVILLIFIYILVKSKKHKKEKR